VTKQSVASLAIKLMAVYVMIWAFPSVIALGATLNQLRGDGTSGFLSGALISFVFLAFLLGVFICLVRRADWLSRKLVPDDESFDALNQVTLADIQTIAFCCIGLLVLSRSIPALVQQLSYIGAAKYTAGSESDLKMFSSLFSQLLSTAVQLAIGLYLFLSPKGLTYLWQRLQKTRPMKSS